VTDAQLQRQQSTRPRLIDFVPATRTIGKPPDTGPRCPGSDHLHPARGIHLDQPHRAHVAVETPPVVEVCAGQADELDHHCAAAGVDASVHQLRHTHATELVNAGVSRATIRKRLGQLNLQTTLRYAEQSDAVADAELRTWRRVTQGH